MGTHTKHSNMVQQKYTPLLNNNTGGSWMLRSPEMKQATLNVVQLLAQGELEKLEAARGEIRTKMKEQWQAKCQQRRAACGSSGWCRSSMCRKSTCTPPADVETSKLDTPLQGSITKDETS